MGKNPTPGSRVVLAPKKDSTRSRDPARNEARVGFPPIATRLARGDAPIAMVNHTNAMTRPNQGRFRHENDHHSHDSDCERSDLPHQLPHGTMVKASSAGPRQGYTSGLAPALLPQRCRAEVAPADGAKGLIGFEV